MPEGDSIHKIADYIRPRLAGRTIRAGRAPATLPVELDGCRVEAVRAHGKHLFFDLDDGTSLRSHLGMYGDWHRYDPGERWKKAPLRASIVVETDEDVWVCFDASEVERLRERGVRARILSQQLGVDLIEARDLSGIPVRARELLDPRSAMVDVLLDQRVAAGIGNVFKNEVLFLHGTSPLEALDDVDDGQLLAMFST